jgi:hypothetical protein
MSTTKGKSHVVKRKHCESLLAHMMIDHNYTRNQIYSYIHPHKRAPAHTYESRVHCANAKQNFAIPLDSVFSQSIHSSSKRKLSKNLLSSILSRQNQLNSAFGSLETQSTLPNHILV